MPTPRALLDADATLTTAASDLSDVASAIAALPSTPLEADLPDIVAIVASLNTITTTLNETVGTALNAIAKVRINQ